jgi:hypothetical protein
MLLHFVVFKISERLRRLNDPNHPAFLRLFGSKASLGELGDTKLRPVQDVIERLLWDAALDGDSFSFVYLDRFDGLREDSGAALLRTELLYIGVCIIMRVHSFGTKY